MLQDGVAYLAPQVRRFKQGGSTPEHARALCVCVCVCLFVCSFVRVSMIYTILNIDVHEEEGLQQAHKLCRTSLLRLMYAHLIIRNCHLQAGFT